MSLRLLLRTTALGAVLVIPGAPAFAASCGTGNFQAWLNDFKTEAAAKGISQSAITSGLNGVTLDQGVLSRDRSQKVFSQSFEEFSGRMVPPRLTRGANMMKQYGSVLSRIEQSYGVPGEVLVAIWGLETDFGVNIGKFPTMRSLATLAYDCRRAETFRDELMDALRIVERGDLSPVGDARRLGRRDRPDPVHAVVLAQIRRRFRRQRPPRPPAQRPRCAGIDRELPCEPRLAARQGLGARQRQFRRDPAMEQERGLCEDHRLFRDPARARALNSRIRPVRSRRACGPEGSRPRGQQAPCRRPSYPQVMILNSYYTRCSHANRACVSCQNRPESRKYCRCNICLPA